jgi:hypothetical protein
MRRDLKLYLARAYQRDVMRSPAQPSPIQRASAESEPLVMDPELVAEIKAEIARIDALRLGANLVSRDFVAYQNRRALVALLEIIETTATMSATETGTDKANFRR